MITNVTNLMLNVTQITVYVYASLNVSVLCYYAGNIVSLNNSWVVGSAFGTQSAVVALAFATNFSYTQLSSVICVIGPTQIYNGTTQQQTTYSLSGYTNNGKAICFFCDVGAAYYQNYNMSTF